MALARIGIGSNLGDAAAQVRAAFIALEGLGTVTACSRLYRSAPWGEREQPDFINAAALLETSLEPFKLLRALKGIEANFGRSPTYRYGPRTLDLDILAYDDAHIAGPELTIPHARLFERAFALVPLAEIDSSFEAACAALPETARASVVAIGA